MKYFSLLLIAVALIIGACESTASIRINNRCNYPIYVQVDDMSFYVTIPSDSEQEFDVDTEVQNLLTGTVTRMVPVLLTGETYQIYDDYSNSYTDSTQVTVQTGKTTTIYIDPNRASIKIKNLSDVNISSADIYRHNGVSPIRITTLENIAPGETRFTHVNYSIPIDASAPVWVPTPSTNYYYYVMIQTDEDTFTYGDSSTILYKDQQFLINFDPED